MAEFRTHTLAEHNENLSEKEEKSRDLIVAVVEEHTSAKPHRPKPSPRFDLDKETAQMDILLVEDSPIMTRFYRRMLEKNYFCVTTAQEEKSAVDFAAKNRPKLILIDDAGRARKAVRIAKQFRDDSRTSSIPLLMMLPVDIFERVRRRIRGRVDMCIPKTFTASVLVPSMQSLLSS